MKKSGLPLDAADAHGLATHYEALRAVVVDPHERNHPMRVRALLTRQGMAAWMKGIEAGSPPAVAPGVASSERQLPTGVEPHLVEVLTTMALANRLEVVT